LLFGPVSAPYNVHTSPLPPCFNLDDFFPSRLPYEFPFFFRVHSCFSERMATFCYCPNAGSMLTDPIMRPVFSPFPSFISATEDLDLQSQRDVSPRHCCPQTPAPCPFLPSGTDPRTLATGVKSREVLLLYQAVRHFLTTSSAGPLFRRRRPSGGHRLPLCNFDNALSVSFPLFLFWTKAPVPKLPFILPPGRGFRPALVQPIWMLFTSWDSFFPRSLP